MATDPLAFYFEKLGCRHDLISDIVIGEKYVCVMLKNGQIGVCATLDTPMKKEKPCFKPEIDNLSHRIILNAYINAHLNYSNDFDDKKDIFDEIDFSKYKNVVMIGFFKSLHRKFQEVDIDVTIFDKAETSAYISDMSQQLEALSNADAAIITGTSIFNNTFTSLVNACNKDTDIFVLGPSSILDNELLEDKRIKAVFGAVFDPHDRNILKIIKAGGGTPDFVHLMHKVYIYR